MEHMWSHPYFSVAPAYPPPPPPFASAAPGVSFPHHSLLPPHAFPSSPVPPHAFASSPVTPHAYPSSPVPPTEPRRKARGRSRRPRSEAEAASEKRRTARLNAGFEALRRCLPGLPDGTRVPKGRLLKMATAYIRQLSSVIEEDERKRESEGSFTETSAESSGTLTDEPIFFTTPDSCPRTRNTEGFEFGTHFSHTQTSVYGPF